LELRLNPFARASKWHIIDRASKWHIIDKPLTLVEADCLNRGTLPKKSSIYLVFHEANRGGLQSVKHEVNTGVLQCFIKTRGK